MADPQVQPKIIQVPSIGNIQFPGDMPDDQISAAIQKNYPQLSAPNAGLAGVAQPKVNVQPLDDSDMVGNGLPSQEDLNPKPSPFLDEAGKNIKNAVAGTGHVLKVGGGTMAKIAADPSPTGIAKAFGEEAMQQQAEGGIPHSKDTMLQQLRELAGDRQPGETATLGFTGHDPSQQPLLTRTAMAMDSLIGGDPAGARAHFSQGATLDSQGKRDEASAENQRGTADLLATPLATVGAGRAFEVKPLRNGIGRVAKDSIADAGSGVSSAAKTVSHPIDASTRSISSILGGGPEAMAKKPLPGATAAGSASNAEVASYAKSKGIDLLPGQATQARGLQTVQAVGERTIISPGELPERLDQQKAAFGNLVDDFKQRVGTEAIPDTEAAGTSLKSQTQHGLDSLKNSAQADYQGFQQQAGDIPVDLSDVKAKAAASLASQAEALKNVPAQHANPVRNVLKKLSDLQAGGEVDPKALADFNNAVDTYGLNPDQQAALRTKLGLPDAKGNSAVKMSTAQQLRSAYLDISRDYSGNVPKSVQRYAGQAAKDIDAAMSKAADSVGATDQWRQANAKWKQLQQTYNNPEHPLYKVLQESDPSKVPSRLLGKGSYGGSPQTVRQLQESGIDLSPLKREVAQQIADKNFALTNGGRGLAGYSSEFLKTLFAPEEFDELTKMGRVGRAIKFEMNPSGTSNVMEGHRQIHGILTRSAGAVVGPIASRLTTSKALARASMGDISAAPQPRGLLDILGSHGPEPPPPETPPAGAAPVTPPSGPGAPPAPKTGPIAAATDERGIKAPQKRTFDRVDEKGVKDYFSYRFDQLRAEMKTAQSSGDQAAITDVQRRMNELDQIQRQPKSLMDILGGKQPQKVDLNAPKSQRVMPPEMTAKADYSGQTVPAKAPTFFSKAEQVAEDKLPNSMKADQVISTLQNAGVKADEMKWLGLDDYLKGKDKVSKADLLDHIRQNNVQVKEVMKASRRDTLPPDFKGSYGDDTKFSNYQLPGGENYRELLLQLPDAGKSAARSSWETYKQELFGKYGTQSQIELSKKATSEEMNRLQSLGDKMEASGKQFNSSHFDEPNILAHVRFNDRVDAAGKKTLFMEELQSDWHQKGRKEGYQVTPEQRTEMDARRQQIESLGKQATPEQRKEWTNIMNELHRSPNKVPDAPFKSTWHELAMKRMLRYAAENGYDQLAWTTGEQQAARYDLSKQISKVQYGPENNGQLLKAFDHDGKAVVSKEVSPEKLSGYIGKDAAEKLLAAGDRKNKYGSPYKEISGLDLKVGGQGMKGFYDKILPDFANKYGKKWGAKVGEAELGTDRLTARGAYEGPTDTAALAKLKTLLESDNWRVSESAKAVLKRIDSGESFDKAMDVGNEGLARELGGKYEFKSEKLPVHSIPITPAMRHEVIFKGQPIAKKQEPRSLMNILSGANA